jgi:hypothetical protein
LNYDPSKALAHTILLLESLSKGKDLVLTNEESVGILIKQPETVQGIKDFLLSLKERLENEVT